EAYNKFSSPVCPWAAGSASGLGVFIDTDGDVRTIGGERVGRHFKVVGRGLVAEDAAGKVERGPVAWAEEAAFPVGGQAGLGAGGERRRRRAAQVRTDADTDEEFGFARTIFVLGVFGGEAGAVGMRIGQQRIVVFQPGQLRGSAMHDPDRLAAP